MVKLVRRLTYFIFYIVIISITVDVFKCQASSPDEKDVGLQQNQEEGTEGAGAKDKHLQDSESEKTVYRGTEQTEQGSEKVDVKQQIQKNGEQEKQSDKNTESPEVKESSSDSKDSDTESQQEVGQEQEVGKNVENQEVTEGRTNSQLVSGGVEGTLVEGPGTETRSEDTEVNTGDTRQLDGVGEQVDDKEQSTGGVLDPVVKDTEQPVLQDPTLIQTVRDTGDSDASRSGVPSPPTVTAPDGRDYKAPVEDRKEGETESDNVELPKPEDEQVETDIQKTSDDTPPTIEESVDMLSFQEWKDKKLQELALEEKAKILEGTQTQNGESKWKSKSHKNRANYAAVICGGKVQATNPEAKNAGFILTENKDQYMIQPCNAKKWFVVELCEPVKVEDLELGNLELFSSLPETFLVSVSDRYPTKEWKVLGTFKAREERAVQSFHIGDDMYAKYVKVEMLTHLGKEHYCPLTILRVHGVTLHDDDAEEDSSHEVMEETVTTTTDEKDSPTLFDSAKVNANAFPRQGTLTCHPAEIYNGIPFTSTNAIQQSRYIADTVISLVKTVLNGDSKTEHTDPGHTEEVVAVTETDAKNLTVETDTKDVGMADTEPCTPDVRTEGEASTVEPVYPDQPEIPRVDSNRRACAPTPLVRLVESPQTSLRSQLQHCEFCEGRAHKYQCMWDKFSVCGYYRVCRFVYPTCCLTPGLKNGEVKAKDLNQAEQKETTASDEKTVGDSSKENKEDKTEAGDKNSFEDINEENRENGDEDNCGGKTGTVIPNSIGEESEGKSEEDNVIDTAPSDVQRQGNIGSADDVDEEHASKDTEEKKPAEEAGQATQDSVKHSTSVQDSEQSTQVSDSTKASTNTQETTSTGKIETTDTSSDSPSMHGPDLIDIWPSDKKASQVDDTTGQKDHTDTEQVVREGREGKEDAGKEHVKDKVASDTESEKTGEKTADSLQKNKEFDKSSESEENSETPKVNEDNKDQMVKDSGQAEEETDQGGIETSTTMPPVGDADKIIYANIPSPDEQEHAQDHMVPPSEEEVPGQKYRSIQKETMYMKLRNKIKELEVNLTLSSRYLEELSVKYRQRMEEMYKSLNKTIQKLTNTSKTAELRDQKQQDRISALEKKMENMSNHMTSLIASIDGIHHEVIERHLYILLIECCIFLAVIGWCLTKQKHHYKERMRTVSKSYFNMTAKNNPIVTPVKGHRRGNSVDISTPSKQKNIHSVTNHTSGIEELEGLRKSGSENDITIIEPSLSFFVCTNPEKKKKKKCKHNQGQGMTVAPNSGYIRPSQLISHRLDTKPSKKPQPVVNGFHRAQKPKSGTQLPSWHGNETDPDNDTSSTMSRVPNGSTGSESTSYKLMNGTPKEDFSDYATQNVFTVLQVESPPKSGPKYGEKSLEISGAVAQQPQKRLEMQFAGSDTLQNGWNHSEELDGKSNKDVLCPEVKNLKDKRKSGGFGNFGKVPKEKGLSTDILQQKNKNDNWMKRKR